MGADVITEVLLEDCSPVRVEKKFEHLRHVSEFSEVDRVEVLPNMVFENFSDAFEYLAINTEKWGPAKAVRAKQKEVIQHSQKLKQLNEQLKNARKEYFNAKQNAKKAFLNQGSKTVTCSECKSRLNKSYLKDVLCPLCDHNLLSKTIKQKLNKKHEKVGKLIDKEAEQRKKEESKAPYKIKWIIGATIKI